MKSKLLKNFNKDKNKKELMVASFLVKRKLKKSSKKRKKQECQQI